MHTHIYIIKTLSLYVILNVIFVNTQTRTWCKFWLLKQNNTVETSKRALVHCTFWLKRVHAAYSQIRKANPLLLQWSNKDPWAENLPGYYTSLQAAGIKPVKFYNDTLPLFVSPTHMYTITHIEWIPVQWPDAIVPLELAFRATENTNKFWFIFYT